MKILIIILLFLIPTSHYPQQDDNDIYWSKNIKLMWTDFKGSPDNKSSESAISWIGLSSPYVYLGDSIRIVVVSYFDKQSSWMRKEDTTDYLLKHEQSHFDIAEVYARKLRKRFLTEKIKRNSIATQVNSLLEQYMDSLTREQEIYDKETIHSKDEVEQKKWNTKIQKMLKEYDNYSDTVIRIRFYD